MVKDYQPVVINEQFKQDLLALVELAKNEDLRGGPDWTSLLTIDESRFGQADIVARTSGIASGFDCIDQIVKPFDETLDVTQHLKDGSPFERGQSLATLKGRVRSLLTAERTVLNLLCRLSGIATMTQQYVAKLSGLKARLYDTRKTTPGMRLLEKYAVRCGGGHSHRHGLHDGILIKDNHLALARADQLMTTAEAVKKAMQVRGDVLDGRQVPSMVEVEVDRLGQLEDCLPLQPDVVLLDNFKLDELVKAVALRDHLGVTTELEASGNITLATIENVAQTGVDRISSGALTHQARSIDLGLDWTGSHD